MDQAYHPDFGGAVNYEFMRLPETPDGQVRSTIRAIRDFVKTDSMSPIVRAYAERMLELGAGDPNLGLWLLIKPLIKFRQDEEIARDLASADPRKDDAIEVLIRPIDQLALIALRGMGVGDCDCFHLTGCALLASLGIPSSLVTVSANQSRPEEFSHVYMASYWNGVRMPLDLSHGEYPGWECPHLGRIQEWPMQRGQAEEILEIALPVAAIIAAALMFRKAYR
jgi:hypothetical protein